MLKSDLSAWVDQAEAPTERARRQAIHTVLAGVALVQPLADISFLKGGLLMALRYNSTRFTQDIDFSTQGTYRSESVDAVLQWVKEGLVLAAEQLPYDIECRVQSHQVKPRSQAISDSERAWVTLEIRIGYAQRGTPLHKRLLAPGGGSSNVVSLDYSFIERVPSDERLAVTGKAFVRSYGFTTLVAEKYRAMIQQPERGRERRQDVYDLHHLLAGANAWPAVDREEILDTLMAKAADRDVAVFRDSLRNPAVRAASKAQYPTLAAEIVGDLPDFDEIYDRVMSAYEALPWEHISNASAA